MNFSKFGCKHRIKHVIWDWNGTILDDIELCVDIVNRILAAQNLAATDVETHRASFEIPIPNYYAKLGIDLDTVPFIEIAKQFLSTYEAEKFSCQLYQYSREIIEMLPKQGLSQSILSAHSHPELLEAVKYFDIAESFSEILGMNNDYGKNKIENGKRHFASLGLKAEEVLIIGDMVHDFEVAQAIGANCLLIAHGHQSKAKLIETGAPVVDDLTGIWQEVKQN